MTLRRRLALLEALARAQEATSAAMLLALEEDDPLNVVHETKKTGPRNPYDRQRALAQLKKIAEQAKTTFDHERVKKVARQLAASGLLTDGDVSDLDKKE